MPLEYPDKRGRTQRPLHTADYFVFRSRQAGWEECKPVEELHRQAKSRPNRYVLDEQGNWRCPPGEAFAAQYGLTYRMRSSDQINWAAQDNWLYLEDYYQDLEKLTVADADLETLWQIVDKHPSMSLADLRIAASVVSSDRINIAIAKHALYVDLATYRLSEPWHAPVFRNRHLARAYARPKVQEDTSFAPPALTEHPSITLEGRELLERASDIDLATAVFRNRVIHPGHYDDDEQRQTAEARVAVPARTRQYWQQLYRDAETRYGSGFLGLLPRYHNCGGNRKIDPEVISLIHGILETHYDTITQKPKRGAYGEYLKRSEEQHLKPVSERTFYTEAGHHKTIYEQTLVREGTRAAYPFKDYFHEAEKTVSRHGGYAWAMAHLDHTELNLVLCDSRTGQPLGKCWLTLLILSHPRRIAAFYLTFDPPSYRSCLAVLRLCVKRYGRLPTAITVDGGPEFQSVYFEQLLALYRVRKHQRPAAEPRFGAPQERLFGTMETEFLYHLLGNTQATQQPRVMTKATDPHRHAVWTLPALASRLGQWADEEYDTIRHPALGMTPREAYELSIQRDGERAHKHIEYDDTFCMATFPTTRKGTAKVEPGVGVRMNYLDYWCEAMRDATVEETQVKVRYDPFDVSIGYTRIDGRWRECITPYTEFAGCSERELQLLTEELRKRNRLQYGREQVELTQKQLAAFRRENATVEAILSQQRHDRETKAALKVLEGGRSHKVASDSARSASQEDASDGSREIQQRDKPDAETPAQKPSQGHDNLLVFRRIHLGGKTSVEEHR